MVTDFIFIQYNKTHFTVNQPWLELIFNHTSNSRHKHIIYNMKAKATIKQSKFGESENLSVMLKQYKLRLSCTVHSGSTINNLILCCPLALKILFYSERLCIVE